ncbi:hypothetical protein GCM10025868_15810 [Angustibacter aerolatus]|uniref:Restriction endonuclease type II-like domain-containing protein n=1 Tax=Angustibacter aerolatus TaxID=1162965 RepID=A0ABQ6JHT2_9ACTN|nr:hypothetical protein GCM10025868_15810 [Angustibacter aerolatus]
MLEHATSRPDETLAVVATNPRHAARVDDALRVALADHPGLADHLLAGGAERFVVTDLTGAGSLSRDAVLLAVGYGRTPHGRVLHRFAALAAPGGDRRLLAATTAARARLTVVSSFAAPDLDAERLTASGPRLLRDLLAWAGSGGVLTSADDAPSEAVDPVARDAVLDDLAERLAADGLEVRRDVGPHGAAIDLAVGERGGPLLVAVESDGATYAAVPSTRDRDRLRVEHLERLGWTHLRIWSTDVFRDPAREVSRVHQVVRAAAARERQRLAALEPVAVPEPVHEVPADVPAEPAQPAEPDGSGGAGGDSPVEQPAPQVATSGGPNVLWDSDVHRADVLPPAPARSGMRPRVPTGLPVGDYSEADLDAVVTWIGSDGVLRTRDEPRCPRAPAGSASPGAAQRSTRPSTPRSRACRPAVPRDGRRRSPPRGRRGPCRCGARAPAGGPGGRADARRHRRGLGRAPPTARRARPLAARAASPALGLTPSAAAAWGVAASWQRPSPERTRLPRCAVLAAGAGRCRGCRERAGSEPTRPSALCLALSVPARDERAAPASRGAGRALGRRSRGSSAARWSRGRRRRHPAGGAGRGSR